MEKSVGLMDGLRQSIENYPFINIPLTAVANKVKVDKVFIAAGLTVGAILLASSFGTGHYNMRHESFRYFRHLYFRCE